MFGFLVVEGGGVASISIGEPTFDLLPRRATLLLELEAQVVLLSSPEDSTPEDVRSL